mmetsp:Transcript_37692/g.59618  ORF Transcript_37692/g.59618 Transcript_37692/m.59618 type:complete len:698 (-) Transcript_37692:161-2254(-)
MGWVLLNNGTRQKLRLRPGTATIGRAQNAHIRPNHQSVSRAHAEIVVELPADDLQEVKQYPIFLIDNSSTGHTFVNTKPSVGKGIRMPLAHGDTLAFGVDPVNFSLQWAPTVLSCSSRMTPAENEYMKALSRKAGVFLTPEWTAHCTHLLMDRLSITPKLLCCTVDGGVPVAASFLTALAETDIVSPVPDHIHHQPQPPLGPDAAYLSELEACVRTPRPKRDFLHDVYVISTAQNVSQALSKALTAAGVKAQLSCGSLQDVASVTEALASVRRSRGPLAEIWVAPTLEDDLANALVGPLLAVGVQRCLSVPLEAIVRGMLLGSREAVHRGATNVDLGRGAVKSAEVQGSDVKAAVKEESFPQTQEHSVVPPSLRGSASEAPATLTRKREDSGAGVGIVKRQCTNGRLEAAKEQHSQEQKPFPSLAVGMAQTVSSFTRTKSEKAAMDAPFTVGSESGVKNDVEKLKQDGDKLKLEAMTRPAATLSSCGVTPSVDGSGMPKILSINFDTPFTQPKPEDEKEEPAKAALKEEVKLKLEAPAPHSLGVVSSGTKDGIAIAQSEISPLAQQECAPKPHPVEVWLPKATKQPQKQPPLIVNVQGLGEIDIRVLRAGVSKVAADPVGTTRKGMGAAEGKNSRSSNGRRNFKLFRKSIGQQVQSNRELVPVAAWKPPPGPGLAEAFASHASLGMDSQSQLPPMHS